MPAKEINHLTGTAAADPIHASVRESSPSPTGMDPKLALLLKEQAQRVMSKVPLLGAVSWLMMQQNATRHTLLSELEWRVMPALVLDQAKLYVRNGAPLAYVSWAQLSDEVAQRFATAPHHLMPADWKSGREIWVVDLCAPFGGVEEIMKDLQTTVFMEQEIRQLRMGADGRIEAVVWPVAG